MLTNCSFYLDTPPTPGSSPPPPAPGQKSFHEKETGWRGTASGKHTSLEATAKRKERSLSQASRVGVGRVLNSFLYSGNVGSLQASHRVVNSKCKGKDQSVRTFCRRKRSIYKLFYFYCSVFCIFSGFWFWFSFFFELILLVSVSINPI